MISRPLSHPLFRWAMLLLSISALTVCLWLLSRKLSGEISSIVGCGGEGGCSQVMGGRWSEWFGVPVTLLASLVYAGVLILALPPVHRRLGRVGDWGLVAAAFVLGGAAVYFLTLLYGVEHQHCPWCLGLHVTGIMVAALILGDAIGKLPKAGIGTAALTGLLALAGLGAGQVWGPKPQTFLLTDGASPGTVAPVPAPAGQAGREVGFMNGLLKYHTSQVPILGSPAAKIVLVEFFDYTCGSCRTLAGDLKELKKKWPDTFGVIVLPSPLNRACNPNLKPAVHDHPGACELARLALALWRAKPDAFPEFHEYLFSLPLPATPERIAEARRKAGSLAGEAVITTALQDPWIAQRLAENFETFGQLTSQSIIMPKLLFPTSGVMHGLARDAAGFLKVMEDQFKLNPGSPKGPALPPVPSPPP